MLHECKGRGKFVMISLKKFPEPFLVVIASLDDGYEHKRNEEGDQGGPWTPLEGPKICFRRS